LSSADNLLRLVVLVSGRGSNLEAIVRGCRDGGIPATVAAVISNKPGAAALEYARQAGITTEVVDPREHQDRETYDRALMTTIDRHRPGLVVLAGFMRVLTAAFVRHYDGRLINIHPALLPQFRGLDTHARALAAGVSRHGASAHFVTEDLDAGPVIVQAQVPVLDGDTAETLAARVLEQEHRIYPLAIRWFAEGRLSIDGGRVLLDGTRRPEQGLVDPPLVEKLDQ